MYDTVLEQIKQDIGGYQPERGGALLGEPGKDIITKFIFDPAAHTTASSYSPSTTLNEQVRQAEAEEGVEYKGIIHSHPGGYDHPSGQDMTELRTGLSLNKHMPFYLVPIVTMHPGSRQLALRKHELAMEEMKISFYAGFPPPQKEKAKFAPLSAMFPSSSPPVSLEKMEVTLIPKGRFQKDLEALCQAVIGVKHPQVVMVDYDNVPMMAGSIEVEGMLDMLLLVDSRYPACKPSILVTYTDGRQEELQQSWSETTPFSAQLEDTVCMVIKAAKQQQEPPPSAQKPQAIVTSLRQQHPNLFAEITTAKRSVKQTEPTALAVTVRWQDGQLKPVRSKARNGYQTAFTFYPVSAMKKNHDLKED